MPAPLRRLAALIAGAVATALLSTAAATAAPYDEEAQCAAPEVPTRAADGNTAPVLAPDVVTVRGGTIVDLPVLANDTDPDGDPLAVLSTSGTDRGTACVLDTGAVRFVADPTRSDRRVGFDYSATDGERLRTTQVTVQVQGTKPVKPVLRLTLRTDKKGKVTRRAALRFTNPNEVPVTIWAQGARRDIRRTMRPGGSFVWRTSALRPEYVAAMGLRSEDPYLVNYGIVNTKTGRHPADYIGMSLSAMSVLYGDFERRAAQSLLEVARSAR